MISRNRLAPWFSLVIGIVCWSITPRINAAEDSLRKTAAERFGTIEAIHADKIAADDAKLGRALFWDRRLSLDGKTACASCHPAADWGADRRKFSTDAKGKSTSRNSQTVFNAMLQSALRWTGDRTSAAHQAEKSLTGSMGFADANAVVPLLKKHDYEPAFRAAFPSDANPVTPANYARAIQAYEATLITPAPFDRYLAGEEKALTAEQKSGIAIFLKVGCADCHHGKLLGGESFEKFGVEKAYWTATKSEKQDAGRFETSKKEADKYIFRVSMLRNIAKTGPYFHDGAVADLKEAVQVMADVQLGKRLNAEDASSIVHFLESLTGDVPKHFAPPDMATR